MMRLAAFVVLLSVGCTGKYIRETTDESVEITPERVARGEYIVNTVGACGACHTGRENGDVMEPESTELYLAGGNWERNEDEGIAFYIPNITSHEDGLGQWSDDEIMRAIRDGINKDGETMFPAMPYWSYQHMSDEDVRSIVAYLRAVPKTASKIKRGNEENKLPFGFKMARAFGAFNHLPSTDVKQPDKTDQIAYGRYLAELGHCTMCHSMGEMGPVDSTDEKWMGGSYMKFEYPGHGGAYASNLSSDEATGLGKYSADQIKNALRTGRRLDGKAMAPPMNLVIAHAAGMTDEDLDAIVAFLGSLPAVEHEVPEREFTDEMEQQLEAAAAQMAGDSELADEPPAEEAAPPGDDAAPVEENTGEAAPSTDEARR